jgi:hypothetical protein
MMKVHRKTRKVTTNYPLKGTIIATPVLIPGGTTNESTNVNQKGSTMSETTTDTNSQLEAGELSKTEYIEEEGGNSKDIAAEAMFEILSNNRRRRVLSHLRNNGKTSDIRALSKHLAALENNVSPNEVTSKQRMRTYTALRQSHLPKMDRTGVVNFDENSGNVTLSSACELEKYLDENVEDELKWIQFYLGVGLIGLGFSIGVYTDYFVFETAPDVLAGLFISVAIISGSLIHKSWK